MKDNVINFASVSESFRVKREKVTMAPIEPYDKSHASELCLPIIADGFEDTTPSKRSSPAEPIKSQDDINNISSFLVEKKRYRDNLLFVLGINYGLRISDLLSLKAGHILTPDGHVKDKVTLQERKTKKIRTIYNNAATIEAIALYFNNMDSVSLNDYLFTSESNNNGRGKPLARFSAERILKDVINDKLGIDVHSSTHCLRKTFAYHVIMNAPDRSRAIEFLQKILGHSSQTITLMYAGITDEEICGTYKELNLGMHPQNTTNEQPQLCAPLIAENS